MGLDSKQKQGVQGLLKSLKAHMVGKGAMPPTPQQRQALQDMSKKDLTQEQLLLVLDLCTGNPPGHSAYIGHVQDRESVN
jgi:hypothetical protein